LQYIQCINELLKPAKKLEPLVLDLFAGCGGLALGFEAAGFQTHGFERDKDCCDTYVKNLHGKCEQVMLEPGVDLPKAPVVIGGPPCQPFSVGGHQKGLKDSRDGFPAFIDVVKRLQPEIWLFENVRGMLYSNKWYFDEILEEFKSLNYIVEFKLLNAVNFGVPQNRERIIVVGHRGIFRFPAACHDKRTAREALADMLFITPPESKFLTPSMDEYVEKYENASYCINPRDLHLDQPARTLTCRNLAGATGDMHRIKLPDGRRRRLLLREAARLQSFPDYFEFCGKEISTFNQVGNAVPPLFAYYIAKSIRDYLNSKTRFSILEIAFRNSPQQLTLRLPSSEIVK
jgi:DNA (cytosine-5)-methyltransferase 1